MLVVGVTGGAESVATMKADAEELATLLGDSPLPQGDLDAALATIMWPPTVAGCAAALQIVVLPPDAEARLVAEFERVADLESEMIKRLVERQIGIGARAVRLHRRP